MRFTVREISLFERPVRLRLPFRFGAATLTEAPQAFVRARIETGKGASAIGGAAELMVPKWFDKTASTTNEENLAQLRGSLALARDSYLAGGANTAFGHFIDNYASQIVMGTM